MPDQTQPSKLTKEQKIGVIFLLSFGILAVAFGILQMQGNINKPFALNTSIPAFVQEKVVTDEALYYRDTDFDGLNDFDEMYVYTTSVYLADTDSDGISDKDEIDQGRNPLCDEDKNCNVNDVSTNPSAFPEKPDQENIFGADAPQNMNEYLQDPNVLRQVLIGSGLDEAVVNNITDEELTAMSQEIFSSSTLMQQMSENPSQTVNDNAIFLNQLLKNSN
jgi:hypothetical protein